MKIYEIYSSYSVVTPKIFKLDIATFYHTLQNKYIFKKYCKITKFNKILKKKNSATIFHRI